MSDAQLIEVLDRYGAGVVEESVQGQRDAKGGPHARERYGTR